MGIYSELGQRLTVVVRFLFQVGLVHNSGFKSHISSHFCLVSDLLLTYMCNYVPDSRASLVSGVLYICQ